jgi:hypothetical protein
MSISSAMAIDNDIAASGLPVPTAAEAAAQAEAVDASMQARADFHKATDKLRAAISVRAMKRANAERYEASQRMQKAEACLRTSSSLSPRSRPARVVRAFSSNDLEAMPM